MNNRIDSQLAELKKAGKKGLITFVTAGDPDLETTYELVLKMVEAGANLIELGIPFSDPVAEGPVIQAANVRALKNNIRLKDVFKLVARLRTKTNIPLVFLLYANSLFRFGPETFFRQCKTSGVDGVILPDLPYEERDEFEQAANAHDVRIITLISPTSGDRVNMLAEKAQGFLYCVSSLGVTGIRSDFKTDFQTFMDSIYRSSDLPAYLGFGISSPESVTALKSYADGVIVGSAIVKLIANSTENDMAVKRVFDFTKALREALDT